MLARATKKRYGKNTILNKEGLMEVVGWGSPVGLTIFMLGLTAAILLLAVAVRVFSGRWLK